MKNQKSKIKNFYYIFFVFYYLLSTIYFPTTYVFAQEATSSAEPTNSEISISPTPSPDPFTPTLTSSPTQPPSTPTEEISVSTPSANLTQPQQINPSQFSSPETLSAKIRTPRKIKSLSKKIFQAKDPLEIEVANNYKENLTVWVKDQNGKNLPIAVEQIHSEENSKIKVYPPQRFRPGKYTINISDSHGNFSEQNFTWGVLAINTNKSIYLPRETVNFAITVLDEAGSMVCNAIVGLDVVGPTGARTSFGTENKSIIINPDCSERDLHPNPDYETSLTLGEEVGIYQMTLTAETQNGKYTVTDSFEVRESVAFDVERIATTRVFPPNSYEIQMRIKAFQDFEGIITETVPADFKISPATTGGVRSYDNIASSSAVIQNAQVSGISSSTLLSPFNGNFPQTQGFGEMPDNLMLRLRYLMLGLDRHDGVDFSMPEGTPIQAVDSGEIISSGWGDYGITVTIQHDWGRSYYGHLSSTKFSEGEKIKAGEIIGLSGNTGLSTGPHLHFALKLNNSESKIDPLVFINKDKNLLASGTFDMTKNNNILGISSSSYDIKKINWNLKLIKGETITIGYVFKAPMISPQFYLLGPLKFNIKNQISNIKTTDQILNINSQSTQSAQLEESTSSGTLASFSNAQTQTHPEGEPTYNETPLRSSSSAGQAINNQQLAINNEVVIFSESRPDSNIVFVEARQWQIAADADVTIDLSTALTTTNNKNKRILVFISDQVGYVFYSNSGAASGGSCVYKKTTDGGANWGGEVALTSGGETTVSCEGITVWYDQWTPGDVSGTYIHTTYIDTTAPGGHDLYYERVDTGNNDSQLGQVVVDATATTLTRSSKFSITKSTSGILYVVLSDDDAGVSKIRQCDIASLGCESAGDWSNVGTSPLDDAIDAVILLPLPGGNVMLIRWDISLEDIQWRYWDGSDWDNPTAGWSNIDTNATDAGTTHPVTFNAVVRRYNNDIYLAYADLAGTLDTAEIRTWYYNGSSWTQKTDVVCSASDGNCSDTIGASESVINLDIAVDEESGDVYVDYLRGTDTVNNLYYKKSTDGMTNWNTQSDALNTSVTNNQNNQAFLNYVDSERIYFVYEDALNADYYGGTIVNLTPPTLDEVMRHGDWWSKVGTRKSFSW